MFYRSILLIDDDIEEHDIFLSAIKKLPTNIQCAATGDASSALKHLKTGKWQTDLIFLDLNMPLMTGQQFLLELKKDKSTQHIPVIIYSTTSHKATIELMKLMGALDFITKPTNFDELVTVLSSILLLKENA